MSLSEEHVSVKDRLEKLRALEDDLGIGPGQWSGLSWETCSVDGQDSEVMQECLERLSVLFSTLKYDLAQGDAELLDRLLAARSEILKKVLQVNALCQEAQEFTDTLSRAKAKVEVALLGGAMPYLHEVYQACNGIIKKDLVELKVNSKPVDVVRFVFDGLLLLMGKPVVEVQPRQSFIARVESAFIEDSFDYARYMLMNARFKEDLLLFAERDKDTINDETCELLEPYLRFDANPVKNWSPWNHRVMDPDLAWRASGAATHICRFVNAMVQYHFASKPIKPKLDKVRRQELILEEKLENIEEQRKAARSMISSLENLDKQFHKMQDGEPHNSAKRWLTLDATLPCTAVGLKARERAAFLASLPALVRVELATAAGDVEELDVCPRDTSFLRLKEQICSEKNIPVMCQQMVLGTQEPRDVNVLADHFTDGLPLSVTLLVSYEPIWKHLEKGSLDQDWRDAVDALAKVARNSCEQALLKFCRAVAAYTAIQKHVSTAIGIFSRVCQVGATLSDADSKQLRSLLSMQGHWIGPLRLRVPLVEVLAALFVERSDEVAGDLLKHCLYHQDTAMREQAVIGVYKKDNAQFVATLCGTLNGTADDRLFALRTLTWLMRKKDRYAVNVFTACPEIEQALTDDRVITALLRCTEDGDWDAQKDAIRLAFELVPGRDQQRIIAALLPRTDRHEPRHVRVEALQLSSELAPIGHDQTITALSACVNSKDLQESEIAQTALMKLAPIDHTSALMVCTKRLRHWDPDVRSGCLQLLNCKELDVEAIEKIQEPLMACAFGDWPHIRCLAVKLLNQLR